jgi:hypothetical protein
MDPLGIVLADKAVRDHMGSARLDGPTRKTPERRTLRHNSDRMRVAAASALHALADRIQPRHCEVARS